MGEIAKLNKDLFVEGGGLRDDFDGKIVKARYEMFDYAGKGPSIPAAALEILPLNEEEPFKQYYSIGDANLYRPNPDDDGETLKVDARIRKSSNFYILYESLVKAGFPEDKMDTGKLSILDNGIYHFLRVPAPKRAGLKKAEREFEETILTVESIIELPGGGKKVGKVEEVKDDEFEMEMVGIVMEAISDSGGKGVPKKDLAKAVFNAFKTEKVKVSKAMGLLSNDEFLKSGPWTFKEGVVK